MNVSNKHSALNEQNTYFAMNIEYVFCCLSFLMSTMKAYIKPSAVGGHPGT